MSERSHLKFLCFSLGGRFFSLDIMGIREILRLSPVTSVPGAPETVRGVINVRGELITVLDMRRIFGIEADEPERRDVRIILAGTRSGRFGMLVDSVQDVVTLEADEIDPAPADAERGAVIGMFKRPGDGEGRIVMLLRLGALARMARGEAEAAREGLQELSIPEVI